MGLGTVGLIVRVQNAREEAAWFDFMPYWCNLLSVLCKCNTNVNVERLAERCVTFLASNFCWMTLYFFV